MMCKMKSMLIPNEHTPRSDLFGHNFEAFDSKFEDDLPRTITNTATNMPQCFHSAALVDGYCNVTLLSLFSGHLHTPSSASSQTVPYLPCTRWFGYRHVLLQLSCPRRQ
eukprot:878583-Pelagomonas_calceolata.AAC.1